MASLNKEIDLDFIKESELIEEDGISASEVKFLSDPDTKITLIINSSLDKIEEMMELQNQIKKQDNGKKKEELREVYKELRKEFCNSAEMYAVNSRLEKRKKFKYNGHLFAIRSLFEKANRAKHNKSQFLSHFDIMDTNLFLFEGTQRETSAGIGFYRYGFRAVITGADWFPEDPDKVSDAMDALLEWYNNESEGLHPIVRAAILHTEFIRIHPFADGNGRTARLLTNYELVKHGYPAVVIKAKDRQKYYDAINKGVKTKDVSDLVGIIAGSVLKYEKKYMERILEASDYDKANEKALKIKNENFFAGGINMV